MRDHEDRERESWNALAANVPFWAVLGRGWARREDRLAEFVASGERDAALALETAHRVGGAVAPGSALDVGCGLGRVTRGFAARFETCVGVDLSPTMVERARTLNADCPNCTVAAASASRLPFATGSFDFVYCRLVLQHLPGADEVLAAIGELLRVTRPAGLAAFQVPVSLRRRNRIQGRRRAFAALRRARVPAALLLRLRLHPVRLVSVTEAEIRRVVAATGGRVVAVEADAAAAPAATSLCFYVRPSPEESASAASARRRSSSSTAAGSSPRAASAT